MRMSRLAVTIAILTALVLPAAALLAQVDGPPARHPRGCPNRGRSASRRATTTSSPATSRSSSTSALDAASDRIVVDEIGKTSEGGR
ncbi:MAG: hypothetical protein R2712_14940 [Vicinamibacterales bacterium]